MTARFTSFSTYKDLVGYINCLLAGGTEDGCYNKGDNGTGASGKVTGQQRHPMVALPKAELRAEWGSTSEAWGKQVRLKLRGKEAIAQVADISPTGVCDLNPAALVALGLEHDTELNEEGEWEWA